MPAPSRVAGQPTWLLSRANARAQALLREAFAREGARGHHFRLLAGLEEGGPCSQAELGRATDIDRSDVVSALGELVASGFVRRTTDPADRRRNVIELTASGASRLRSLQEVLDGVRDAVLAPLAPTERDALRQLLVKLSPDPDPQGG